MKKTNTLIYLCLLFIFFNLTNAQQTSTALDFDGTNDYILYDNPVSGTTKSTTCWIKTTKTSKTLLNSNFYINRFQNDGKVYSFFDSSTGNGDNIANQSTTSVADGNWHHIASTNDGSITRLYVDGVLEATYSDTYNPQSSERIGGNHDFNLDWYDGQLDEYATWSKTLTQQEIISQMNQKLTGNESGLAVYFDFEEGVPNGNNSASGGDITQVINQAGSNNGTVNNFARTGTSSNWVDGKTFFTGNTALYFDGVDDYIQYTNPASGTSKSVSFWISTSATTQTLVCSGLYISRFANDGKV